MREPLKSSEHRGKRVVLPSHQACLQCRSRKKKCDAKVPRCGRCVTNDLPCHSQAMFAARRRRIDIYEERVLDLEHQLALVSKAHTCQLISQSLWEKLCVLSNPSSTREERRAPLRQLAFWPHEATPITAPQAYPWGRVVDEELEIGFAPAVPREMMGQMVRTWTPTFDGSALPAAFSLWMIRLFLPYRIHHFFFHANLRVFFAALSYSPEDPRGVHPALMNAIYLATCWVVGRELDFLKKHFLAQTRFHLAKALETGDRLIDFLWANLILGNFLALEGRMNEAYVTVSSTVEFALACGLHVVHYRDTTLPTKTPLLPPPVDKDDANDRIRLSFALYVLDRTLAMITGHPSAFAGDKGPSSRLSDNGEDGIHAWHAPSVDSETLRQEMDTLLRNPLLPPPLIPMIIYERIEQFARQVDLLPATEVAARFLIYSEALNTQSASLPFQLDRWGVHPTETFSQLSPVVISRHLNYHGCVMLLYSLEAKNDMKARDKVIDAARALAELSVLVRGKRGLKPMHASLLLMLHMTNAARVLASYISTPEVKMSTELFAMCSESLGMLVDILDDSSAIFPAWAHVLQSLHELFPSRPPNDSASIVVPRAPATSDIIQ